VQRLAEDLGAELVPMGSAGAKAAAVITGEADAYVHSGGQYEWDSAAPVAVARAAGLHASRIDGSPLVYNQADPSVPDILISPARLAPVLLAAIASARTATSAGRPAQAGSPPPIDSEF
jgi:3'(2'), 5'-bisphosphate nucleotidase